MSLRLKFILGFLVIAAGFLVMRTGVILKQSTAGIGLAGTGQRVLSVAKENPGTLDSDRDGIADFDEAYYRTDPFDSDTDDDGYLDGEEIASGFNPTRKDQGGQVAGSKNLTVSFVERLVSGIHAGDLNPRNGKGLQYDNGLNKLTLASLDAAVQTLAQPPGENPIKLVADSEVNQEKYLQDVSQVLDGPFLTAFMDQPRALNRVGSFLHQGKEGEAVKVLGELSGLYGATADKLADVSVPNSFSSFHKELASTFRELSSNYQALSRIKSDPLLAAVALENVSASLVGAQSLAKNLGYLIKNNGLQAPNSILFNTLKLLNF